MQEHAARGAGQLTMGCFEISCIVRTMRQSTRHACATCSSSSSPWAFQRSVDPIALQLSNLSKLNEKNDGHAALSNCERNVKYGLKPWRVLMPVRSRSRKSNRPSCKSNDTVGTTYWKSNDLLRTNASSVCMRCGQISAEIRVGFAVRLGVRSIDNG